MTYKDIMEAGKIFAVLNDNEAKVVKLKYGFEDGKVRNTAEVAASMQISRERARQIEMRAKEKITIVLEYEGKSKI